MSHLNSFQQTSDQLVFGTRGSLLARTQTEYVQRLVEGAHPSWVISTEIIRTEGDDLQKETRPQVVWPSLGVGVFTRQLENALIDGAIDVAVHSLKDLPTRCPDRLVLAAIPERACSWDLLIFPENPGPLENWSSSSWVIGTSSIRREAFLRRHYSKWSTVPIRGNVDTRLKKCRNGACNALILAAAGLQRLGWWSPSYPSRLKTAQGTFFVYPLNSESGILPAPGQGALAIQMRADDPRSRMISTSLNHAPTAASVAAERSMLEALGGGCRVPIGALGTPLENGCLRLQGMVVSPDGRRLVDGEISGPLEDAEGLGRKLGAHLASRGAMEMLGEQTDSGAADVPEEGA
jgi:hydroxymethylbilane synthase